MSANVDGRTAAMNLDQIIEMLIDILARDLEVAVPREQIHPETTMAQDLGLDSVALLGLVAAIEERLDFELRDAVLLPSTFLTVRSVAEGIAASIAASNTA